MPNREKAIAYRNEWLRQLFGQLDRGTYWNWEFSDNTREEALREHENCIAQVQAELAALHALPSGSEGDAVLAAVHGAVPPRKAARPIEYSVRGILC